MERLSDGTPIYVQWAEEWLAGGAMLANQDDALVVALIVEPSDFRDQSLGMIWSALLDAQTTMIHHVAAVLHERGQLDEVGGEPRLASLCTTSWAWLYSGLSALEAHAGIVKDWSNRRRLVREAGEVAAAILDGKPITRGVKVRGLARYSA